jgi:hypothetical protein
MNRDLLGSELTLTIGGIEKEVTVTGVSADEVRLVPGGPNRVRGAELSFGCGKVTLSTDEYERLLSEVVDE